MAEQQQHILAAAAAAAASTDPGTTTLHKEYTHFSGPASKFPAESEWVKFSIIWNIWKPLMQKYAHDSPTDTDHILHAINTASGSTHVDKRLILAVIMQESSGNIRAHSTIDADGKGNGGLMQAEGSPGAEGQKEVSQAIVDKMVLVGSQALAWFTKTEGGNPYDGLRGYNSGTKIDKGDLSKASAGTPSYVSDVANRLRGWHN
ncbi:MAG: hypothetical protein M1812_006648 [Candelaria pacifica]|nr:MAG: hypothetical protein M1812_006648 [Candelaria pacifica]